MKTIIYVILTILLLQTVLAENENGKIVSGGDLLIDDVDVKVDGLSSRNLNYGDEIKREAKSGSVIDFEIRIKNNNSGTSMEEVEMVIEIDDLDLEEMTDESSIDANDKETLKLSIILPSDTEYDEYEILIEAEGDLNNSVHKVEYILDLIVEKSSTSTSTSSTLGDLIISLNNTLGEVKNNENYFDPYTKCTAELEAKKVVVSSKDTEISTLKDFKTLYQTCEKDKKNQEDIMATLKVSNTNLKLNMSNLYREVQNEKDSRMYWILGLIIAGVTGFIIYKKRQFPDHEVDEEANI
ncbi:hypothetical protein CMI43_03260 [Candidatus Pacearchaeota archaeon]|nr:hypothetical protein [Candidatus Pacearchaeota archaeon]|tara:strand:- start:4198 stop:5085 length:888 start_codon:yes stop_codon:yes gene_type:complete